MLGVISQDAPDAPFRPVCAFFSAKNVQNAAFSLDGRQKTLYDDTGSVRVRQVDREASLPSSA
jgi:hypothetical protein